MKHDSPCRLLALLLVCALALACVGLPAHAALADGSVCPDFFWQNPLPQGNALRDIAVLDAGTAWVVGDYGTIMKTTDAGATWNRQVSGTTEVLNGISALSSSTAWAVGEGNVVLKTTDGGRSWTRQASATPADFNSVSAVNSRVAFIGGGQELVGVINRTDDGGRTWTDVSPLPLDYVINGVSAVSANVAWAVTEFGNFHSTVNGGADWNRVVSPIGGIHNRVQAFSATRAYAVTDGGYFLETTDGTAFNATIVKKGNDLKSLMFTSRNTGWVVGGNGYVGVTTDAGGRWAACASPVADTLLGIGARAGGSLYACGMSGQLLRSAGGSGPWIRLSSGDTDGLFDICSSGDRAAWACGFDGTVLRTNDGGATWSPLACGLTENLFCIDSFGHDVVWVGGANGALSRTADGGATWTRLNPVPRKDRDILSVSVTGKDSAWISGWAGLLMKTSDGGASWQTLSQGSSDNLEMAALDSRTVFCARMGSDTVMKSVDGGARWTRQVLRFTGHSVRVNNLCVINKDVVFASASVVEEGQLGDFGMVFKTVNGGGRWSATMSRHTNLTLFDVGSADGVNVWTCGLFGFTLKSSDGGASWEQQDALQMDSIYNAADAVDGQTAWLVGRGGYIVRTTAPHVYSISPSSAGNTGTVEIDELAGNGFQPGMQVKLVNGRRQIQAADVDVISPYRAACRFDLRGAPEADWDVVATNTNGLSGALPNGFHVYSCKHWYLAEGSTGMTRMGSFETWVLLQNPGAVAAKARLTYLTPEGGKPGPEVVIPPGSRATVNVEDTMPNCWEVSTLVDSTVPVVVERAMYWDNPSVYRESAAGSIGTPFLSRTWYLAEGSTGQGEGSGFETYVTVANAGNSEAEVALTFMTPGGSVPGPVSRLGAGIRWTVDASRWVPNEWSVSTKVTSDKPVVAERSVYWNTPASTRSAAHNSIGAAGPSKRWFMAEGSTGRGPGGSFETWVVVQNPGECKANATLFYETPSGQVAGPAVVLGPGSRRTVNVAETVPDEFSVSTRVESDNPVVAERSSYFNTAAVTRQAAQSSVGTSAPSTDWNLAEGSTGGDEYGAFETWVLVQNPGDAPAVVNLEYMTTGGRAAGPVLTLGAHSRVSINVGETVPDNWSVATLVSADVPVVAEAAVYWNAHDLPRQNAHDSIGFSLR